jgi:hypothetical protein
MMLALVVVLSQGALLRGDLQKLARWSDRVELSISHEQGNLLAPAALRELQRWPGMVTLELRLPVKAVEAAQLRELRRFAALVPKGREHDASLKLLAPALLRVRSAALPPLAQTSCAGAEADQAEEVLLLHNGADACALQWLSQRLELRPDPPRDPSILTPSPRLSK